MSLDTPSRCSFRSRSPSNVVAFSPRSEPCCCFYPAWHSRSLGWFSSSSWRTRATIGTRTVYGTSSWPRRFYSFFPGIEKVMNISLVSKAVDKPCPWSLSIQGPLSLSRTSSRSFLQCSLVRPPSSAPFNASFLSLSLVDQMSLRMLWQ